MEVKERLDNLRAMIQTPEFLEGKGLSNEVNIRIFSYNPKEEMIVQHFVDQLKTDPSLSCNVVEYNLFQIFLSVCDDLDIMDSIPEMEAEDGSAYTLEQLQSAVGEAEFIDKMQSFGERTTGDVMIISGVGDVFPFMRVHKLLEAIQPYFSNVPVLVMYPGNFDGNSVSLFNKLKPNPYYRAFSII